jgi:hypothetical protein
MSNHPPPFTAPVENMTRPLKLIIIEHRMISSSLAPEKSNGSRLTVVLTLPLTERGAQIIMFPRSIRSERHKRLNNRGEDNPLSSCDVVDHDFPSLEIYATDILGSE